MDSELEVLVAVARTGSFHSAALSLGLPRSTLRRRIERLEARIGAPLVHSTRQGATLTPAGRQVVRHGQAVLREIETMLGRIRTEDAQLVGELRVALPPGIPPAVQAGFLQIVRRRLPRLRWRFFQLDYGDPDWHANVDLIIDVGELSPPAGWLTHEIDNSDDQLRASPAYLRRRGTPARVEDLREHDLLMWALYTHDTYRLPCTDGTTLEIVPVIVDSSLPSLYTCAALGLGIAFGPDSRFVNLPSGHELVSVLPDQVRRPRPLRLHVSAELASLSSFAGLVEMICEYVRDYG